MSGERVLGCGDAPKMIFVTRAETSPNVELLICNNGVHTIPSLKPFDPEGDAARVLDTLMHLPVETRRAFYVLLTQEMAEGFNAAPRPEPRSSPPITPSARRSRRSL